MTKEIRSYLYPTPSGVAMNRLIKVHKDFLLQAILHLEELNMLVCQSTWPGDPPKYHRLLMVHRDNVLQLVWTAEQLKEQDMSTLYDMWHDTFPDANKSCRWYKPFAQLTILLMQWARRMGYELKFLHEPDLGYSDDEEDRVHEDLDPNPEGVDPNDLDMDKDGIVQDRGDGVLNWVARAYTGTSWIQTSNSWEKAEA